MAPSHDDSAPAPKIAIKGFSLSSKPNNSKPGAKPPPPKPTLGKRPRSTLNDEDSDSDENRNSRGKHEAVIEFGQDGAKRRVEIKKAAPLVIARQGNNDWRTKKGSKNLLPSEVQAQMRDKEAQKVAVAEKDVLNGKDDEPVWGLTVRKREAAEDGDGAAEAVATETKVEVETVQEPVKPRTAEEEALDALLGNDNKKKGPAMVIPVTSEVANAQDAEDDAYWKAIREAPDVATLEEYEAVPVEEFGAALLRGMGWNGDAKAREKKKETKRRQNLLGLGAKQLDDAEELGAWVQQADTKRLKPAGDRRPARKPKPSDYRRDKDKRDERRDERGGGSYRDRDRDRERERERNGGRDRYDDRDRDRRR